MGGADEGRNVVLVSVDSLRADVCYGEDSVRTPALDALAESGGRFANAIAPGPATYESMPAIFTGVDVPPVGPIGGVAKRERIRTHLRSHYPLAARLADRGYRTVGVTPNPFTSRQFGFDTGFDRFVDFLTGERLGGRLRSRLVDRWIEGRFVGGLRFASNMLGVGDVSVTCSEVVDRAVAALDGSEPFFLWVMFLDPHWPYRPPPRHRDGVGVVDRYRANWRASNLSSATPSDRDAAALRSLYRGTVQAVDECLAGLRDRLEGYDPVFVVHADHGEAFGEHGGFGHGGRLYEENVHVPLVVGGLGDRDGDGGVVQEPVSLRQIPRLVTHVAGGGRALEGFGAPWVHARSEAGAVCVRGREWKYYQEPDGTALLYDLANDPFEADGTDLAAAGSPLDTNTLGGRTLAHFEELVSLTTAAASDELTGRL